MKWVSKPKNYSLVTVWWCGGLFLHPSLWVPYFQCLLSWIIHQLKHPSVFSDSFPCLHNFRAKKKPAHCWYHIPTLLKGLQFTCFWPISVLSVSTCPTLCPEAWLRRALRFSRSAVCFSSREWIHSSVAGTMQEDSFPATQLLLHFKEE